MTPSRRRIDRVTAPGLLDGASQRSVATLRQQRDDCREEEARLSYTRRLLQGQLDVVRAELARRSGEEAGSLVDQLPRILADRPAPGSRVARAAPVYDPGQPGDRRREDSVLDEVSLADLPDLTDEELAAVADRLSKEERVVSELRRTVLSNLDGLQDELIGRYREDSSAVGEAVGSVVPPPPSTS